MARLYGGIEAGGTKFVCTVASVAIEGLPSSQPVVQEEIRFPTTQPEETIQQAINFFRKHQESLVALGIGSFGPVDLNPDSTTYGYITTTPKKAWVETDFVGQIEGAFGLPVGFDTDVNAAALGERHWGAARGLDSFVYLTIGTGTGGGGMSQPQLMAQVRRQVPELLNEYVQAPAIIERIESSIVPPGLGNQAGALGAIALAQAAASSLNG